MNYTDKKLLLIGIVVILAIRCIHPVYSYELISAPEKVYGVDNLTEVALSKDGSLLITYGPLVAYVWDTQTWQITATYRPSQDDINPITIRSCKFSEGKIDLMFLLEMRNQNIFQTFVEVWNIDSNQVIKTQPEPLELNLYATNNTPFFFPLPDGRRYLIVNTISTTQGSLSITSLIDIETGDVLKEFFAMALAVAPDGKTFYSGINMAEYNLSYIWDIETNERILPMPSGSTTALYSPDGTKLITYTNFRNAKLIDVISRSEVDTFSKDTALREIFFSPDSKKIGVFYGLNQVDIYDTETGEKLKELRLNYPFPKTNPASMAFLPDNTHFIATNAGGVSIYNADSGQEIACLTDVINQNKSLNEKDYHFIFSTDGNRILMASYSYEGNAMIIDTQTGADVLNFVLPAGEKVFTNKLDKFFAYSTSWQETFVYKVASPPSLINTIPTGNLTSADYSPVTDQLLIRNFFPGEVELWNVSTAEKVAKIPTRSLSIRKVNINNDATKVLITYADADSINSWVELRELPTGDLLGEVYIKPDTSISTNHLLSDYNNYWFSELGDFFDMTTGELLYSIPENNIPIGNEPYQFSPNGEYVAILTSNLFDDEKITTNSYIGVFSIETGEEVFRLPTNQFPAFAPDSSHIYTYGENGPVHYWSLKNQSPVLDWQLF